MRKQAKATDQFSVIIGTRPEVLLLSVYDKRITDIDPPHRMSRRAGLLLARERLQIALAGIECALTSRRVAAADRLHNPPDIPA